MNRLRALFSSLRKEPQTLAPWVAWIAIAIFYASQQISFLIPGDNTEFITAAVAMGLPHPTGYPLTIAIGKLLTGLFFFLKPEQILNASSLLFLLGSFALLIHLARRLALNPWATAAAIVALATSFPLWEYSRYFEAYPLAILIFSIWCWSLIRSRQPDAKRAHFWLMIAMAGIAPGAHMTLALLPAFTTLWLLSQWKGAHTSGNFSQNLTALGLLLFLGLALLGLLFWMDHNTTINYINQYLAEFPDPRLDNPLNRIIWTITGAPYQAANVILHPWKVEFWLHLGKLGQKLYREVPLLCSIGLPSLLIFAATRIRKEVGLYPAIAIAAFPVGLFIYLSTYQEFFEAIFFAPALWLSALGLAYAATHLRPKGKLLRWAPLVLIVALTAATLTQTQKFPHKFKPQEEKMLIAFAGLPPHAVLFSTWNLSTYLWYHQYVEQLRPDITVANAAGVHWLEMMGRQIDRPLYIAMESKEFPKHLYNKEGKFFRVTASKEKLLQAISSEPLRRAEELLRPKEAGSPWDQNDNFVFPRTARIEWKQSITAQGLELSLDNNDRYELQLLQNNEVVFRKILPPTNQADGGMAIHRVDLGGPIHFDAARLLAISGDHAYSVGHLVALSSRPGK